VNVLTKLKKQIKQFSRREIISHKMAARFGVDSKEFNLVMKACDESCTTHHGGKRDNGDSLISHERAMIGIADYIGVKAYYIYVAIFLHDMHEDYPKIWSVNRIFDEYGSVVAELVDSLSKPEKSDFLTTEEYDEEIFCKVRSGGYWAMVIKCIDRLHNMITLYGTKEKIIRKTNQTVKYMLPISIDCNTLTYELMVATTEQVRKHGLKTKLIEH
jgi:(p)ppGpp synthase/HD superfamily hydrolase